MEDLPPEVLQRIFEQLPCNDLIACLEVSVYLKSVAAIVVSRRRKLVINGFFTSDVANISRSVETFINNFSTPDPEMILIASTMKDYGQEILNETLQLRNCIGFGATVAGVF